LNTCILMIKPTWKGPVFLICYVSATLHISITVKLIKISPVTQTLQATATSLQQPFLIIPLLAVIGRLHCKASLQKKHCFYYGWTLLNTFYFLKAHEASEINGPFFFKENANFCFIMFYKWILNLLYAYHVKQECGMWENGIK
jgi:arginine exporter protein ArgO